MMTLDPKNSSEQSTSIYEALSKAPKRLPPGLKLPLKKSSIAVLTTVSLIAIVSTASIAGSIFMKGKETAAKSSKPVPVATVTVQPAQLAPVPDVLELTGSISATDPLSIGSSAGGLVITQVNAEEGDYVKKGQILASLDSSVLRAQLAAAEARFQGAGASVVKATQPNRPEDIGSFEAAYKQAMADVQNRRAMLEQAKASRMLAQNNAGATPIF